MNERLTITEVAKYVGVTPRTIMRWEKSGKIRKSRRDWRGWRFYIKDDVEDIRKFYESSYEYDQIGRTIMDLSKTTAITLLIVALLASLTIVGGSAEAQNDVIQSRAVTETKSSVNINLGALPMVQPPPLSVAEASKYTLGPDDIIEVDVRRHPEFSGQYTITAEGKIEYKFVGDIIVLGLTKVQLQERLAGILSEFIIEPEVNVRIVSYLSKVYYVVGEVNRPGKFFMKGNTISVREAIIQAGLPAQTSATRRCRLITPNVNGKQSYKNVNVFALLYEGNLKEDKEMKPGDVLYVPATVLAKIISVISPVTNAVSSAAGSAAAGASMVAVGL